MAGLSLEGSLSVALEGFGCIVWSWGCEIRIRKM
jgi:hypothetical protein